MPPLLTRREARVGALAIVATAVVAPFDHPVDGELQEPGWQRSESLGSAASHLAFWGGPGPFVLAAGLIAGGNIARLPVVAETGLHLGEGVLLAASVTGIIKGIAGCRLPGIKTAHSCQFGRGFHRGNGPFVSFPSGHTAAAFATASVLSSEVAWHDPELARFVTPVVYSAAAGVAVARLYQHVHWVSDLPLAAAIGTWAGMTVVGRARAHTQHWPARIIHATTVAPAPRGGVALAWSVSFGGAGG